MTEQKSEELSYWRVRARELSIDEFAEEYRCPFLLRSPPPAGRGPGADFDDLAFKTDVADVELVSSRPSARPTEASRVIPIVKSDRNPFTGQISVGRAKNCDIILRDGSVSKNHAYFRVVNGATAELVDTQSQNCTRVNASPIKPVVPVEVVSGDTIIFGSVLTRFLDARALYRLL